MDITLISSLYRTDAHIRDWKDRLLKFAKDAQDIGLAFQINAIANDPQDLEREVLSELVRYPWFKLTEVPRESLYATWNRGVRQAESDICGFWNVDDIRFADAILDGIRLIRSKRESGEGRVIAYFPFIYKRYVKILGMSVLAKRKRIVPPEFDQKEFVRSMHSGPFFIFTKKTFDEIGPFDPEFTVVGDYEWSARAASQGASFVRSLKDAGIFKNDGTTLSGNRQGKQLRELLRVLKKYNIMDKYEELSKRFPDSVEK